MLGVEFVESAGHGHSSEVVHKEMTWWWQWCWNVLAILQVASAGTGPLPYRVLPAEKDLSCRGVKDRHSQFAWNGLKELMNEVNLREDLPRMIWHYGPWAFWYDDHWPTLKRAVARSEKILLPLPEGEECVIGRWAAWFTGREFSFTDYLRDHPEKLEGRKPGLPFARQLAQVVLKTLQVDELAPAPLMLLIWGRSAGETARRHGIEVTMRDVGDAEWHGLFAMGRRLRSAVYTFMAHYGMEGLRLGPHRKALPVPDGLQGGFRVLCSLQPQWAAHADLFLSGSSDMLSIIEEVLVHHNKDAVDPGPSLGAKLKITERLELAIQGWSSKMIQAGLGWSAVVFAYLAIDEAWDLFGAIYRLWLPSAGLLRFPEATYSLMKDKAMGFRPPILGPDPRDRLRPSACQHIKSALLHGAAADMRLPPVQFTNSTSPSGVEVLWRCYLAMRTLRAPDHVTSMRVWARSTIPCAVSILDVFALYVPAALACWQSKSRNCPRVRYVDVGSNLGDCALAATGVFPEGSLIALAVDGDTRVMRMLEQTIELNGLNGDLNSSTSIVQPHTAMYSDHVEEAKLLPRFAGGIMPHFGYEKNGLPTEEAVPTTTLDEALQSFGGAVGADIVSIFDMEGMSEGCLRGATALMRRKAVDCFLVMCQHGWEGAKCTSSPTWKLLHEEGYKAELSNDGEWIKASPASTSPICSPSEERWGGA